MSATAVWYLVVGASALALTLLYRRLNRKPPKPPPASPKRWHDGFDDVV